MTATGEIIDSKPHIHAVMAIQGDRAVAGHLIQGHFGTSFAHAYVIPSEQHIALRGNEGVVLKYFAGDGPAGRGRMIDQRVAPEHEHLGTHAVTTWPDTTPMQFRTIDGLLVASLKARRARPGSDDRGPSSAAPAAFPAGGL
jgi:hypothetical protein